MFIFYIVKRFLSPGSHSWKQNQPNNDRLLIHRRPSGKWNIKLHTTFTQYRKSNNGQKHSTF